MPVKTNLLNEDFLDKQFYEMIDNNKVPEAVIRVIWLYAVKGGLDKIKIDKAFHYIKKQRSSLKLHRATNELDPFESFYNMLFFRTNNFSINNLKEEFVLAMSLADDLQIHEAFNVFRYFYPEEAKQLFRF